ncbi:ATP-dependent sacrificial sulfur transferase LarE [Maricurvus nonylphenolicus]|uniref:ATP-dependent sacrificial sulfur transferase LarE n=1 Tax=Maricurvus nonylphenolicus TaxID=1008307 RepID=UPI0036F3C8AE
MYSDQKLNAYSTGGVIPDIELVEYPSQLEELQSLLKTIPCRLIACSGGIDSLLLATVAHRQSPQTTTVAHAISPAVPEEATARVRFWAEKEGWNLVVVQSGEFQSEEYLSNPVNRCYYCKSNLYHALSQLSSHVEEGYVMMSGANQDDLGEYRPGLIAASENCVRHPYVETEISKQGIRDIAHALKLPFADLPASPCLASRLYTGTRVTPERLRAVEVGEALIRRETGIQVVRCRVKEDAMYVEVGAEDRPHITPSLLAQVKFAAKQHINALCNVQLDAKAYSPGRAFVQTIDAAAAADH